MLFCYSCFDSKTVGPRHRQLSPHTRSIRGIRKAQRLDRVKVARKGGLTVAQIVVADASEGELDLLLIRSHEAAEVVALNYDCLFI